MEVAAAPLLVKRRGMKRKSGGDRPSSMDPSKKCPTTRQLESVPEADASLEMSRPSTLTLDPSSPLMDYRTPKPSTIRDTRDSV